MTSASKGALSETEFLAALLKARTDLFTVAKALSPKVTSPDFLDTPAFDLVELKKDETASSRLNNQFLKIQDLAKSTAKLPGSRLPNRTHFKSDSELSAMHFQVASILSLMV